MRRLALILMVSATAVPGVLVAQTPQRAAPLLELPAGARAAGLGGTAQIGVADPDHLFAHPAFLGSGGFRIDGQIVDGGATVASASAGTGAFGGRVGVGVRTAEWDGRPPGASIGGLDELAVGGDVGRSTLAATIGYVRDAPFDLLGLDVGVTATLLAERADDRRDRSVSFDVGVGRRVGPLSVGFAARSLGADLDVLDDAALPTRLELTAGGYGRRLGPLDFGTAARVGVRDDDEVVVGGGLELGYYPIQGRTFIVRVGGQSVPEGDASPLTLGATFRGDEIVLDYAWRDVDGSGMHSITIGWR